MGKNVDIYTNSCLDTHIYYMKGLDDDIIKKWKAYLVWMQAKWRNRFGINENGVIGLW